MMSNFRQQDNQLIWEQDQQIVQIEAWGRDSLRVRATLGPAVHTNLPQALLAPPSTVVDINIRPDRAVIRNGHLAAEITTEGALRFFNTVTEKELLAEAPYHFTAPPPRSFKSIGGDHFRVETRFKPKEGERFYGLGQHRSGYLDQKGCIIDLIQRNSEVSIPFLLSNLGYGFLWNNPAIGRVELGCNGTHWVAEASRQLDYWVTTGDAPVDILDRYTEVTGRPPLLPEFAAGFWQCKLRYRTQEELLSVAREYKQRGLPLSVIVIDFFHWTAHGDWQFDPACWPDPAAMVRELDELDVKVMVSVWPTLTARSVNFDQMNRNGWLIHNARGTTAHNLGMERGQAEMVYMHYYDATHPAARQFIWQQVRDNYYRHGIKVWWLDACEPEMIPFDPDNLRFYAGDGQAVANFYPLAHEQAFYEGMRAEGEEEIIMLCRSGWAGSQRYGAALWSGDIPSTFEALQAQVRAGLNVGLSGIPWWTTDIGGFGFPGGNIESPYFRELIVRWFQYGVFCPLFRLHGYRQPNDGKFWETGAANEVWSFGDEAYEILREYLFLRERLRPYIMEQMRLAHQRGVPPMRPLFFDFPGDPDSWTVEDQFMFGPDLLVAPVLFQGDRCRQVYLPDGTTWTDAWSGKQFSGGQTITAAAPLERIPLYVRNDIVLPINVKGS
jgi:alpha-D-xyloside xylohydrolase